MTDFQAYIASVTLVALSGMIVVANVARYAIAKAIPDKGHQDQ